MDSPFTGILEDQRSIITYTVEIFSFLLLRNERVSLAEFAKRISMVTTPCKRTLLGIHSLLAADGTIERRYNGIALHRVKAQNEQEGFPIFSGWGKWSENQIHSWLKRHHCRLTKAGIAYPVVS